MPSSVPPPRPPLSVPVFLDKEGNLYAHVGLGKWVTPAAGASVQALDNTGKRVTLTRAALLGVFALAAKKRTGDLTLILAGVDGSTHTVKVKPKKAQEAQEWAARFNAWSAAQTAG